MADFNHLENNFTAGEVTPRIRSRTELNRYKNGAKTITNMVCQTYGGVKSRPGTKFVAPVKDSSKKVILIEFEFSTTQAYIIEAGEGYFRFFKDNQQIRESAVNISGITKANPGVVTTATHGYSNGDHVYISGVTGMTEVNNRWFIVANKTATTFELTDLEGNNVDTSSFTTYSSGGTTEKVYEISSPFQEEDLFELDYIQSADVLFLVHGDYTPRELTRTGDTSWTLSETSFTDGPYLTENVTSTTLTPSGTSGSVTVTASATTGINGGDGFQTTDVGRIIRWHDGTDWHWLTITARSSTTVVTATVETSAAMGGTTATTRWRLGAWSDTTGWPSKNTFFESRYVLANNTDQPDTIWGSATDDFNNFAPDSDNAGTLADDVAVTNTLNSTQVNAIRWLRPHRRLRVGTAGAIWSIGGTTTNETWTPTNVKANVEEGEIGSANIRPVQVGSATIFLQRAKKKVRALKYDFNEDGLKSTEISLVSEHISGTGIEQISYQAEPDGIVWLVRTDGTLVGLTYLPDPESVLAWHKHTLGGSGVVVESVASVPISSQTRTWLSVKRTIDSNTVRYIEYFNNEFNNDDIKNAIFSDSSASFTGDVISATLTLGAVTGDSITVTAGSGVFASTDVGRHIRSGNGKATIITYNSSTEVVVNINRDFASTSISSGAWTMSQNYVDGLYHLRGETVSVLTDGGVHPQVTVSSLGVATLNYQSTNTHIGEGYTQLVETLDIDAGSVHGTAKGSIGAVHEIVAELYETVGIDMGSTTSALTTIDFRQPGSEMDEGEPLFTGIKRIRPDSGFSESLTAAVRSTQPLPITLLGLVIKGKVSDES